MEKIPIIAIIGPTASGKTAKAIALAKEIDGEIISVDSRQVYRGLDIGTEKISKEEMGGIPHHLIDIRDPKEIYSAGDFVHDADALIKEIAKRGKKVILAGGTHFYFDALIYGLPKLPTGNSVRRKELEHNTPAELFTLLQNLDTNRAETIDKNNSRRLIRAIEIAEVIGKTPTRVREARYEVTWHPILPDEKTLKERLSTRLAHAFSKGLIDEVKNVRAYVGDERLNELGLEYRIVGEFLRHERDEASLIPALETKLRQYAKDQMKWIRKLTT